MNRRLALKPNSYAIGEHAAIGDCRSVALIARDGTLNWLCWPLFSSGALFAGLLDPLGGHFRVTADEPAEITRRYLPDTNVLETIFTTASGVWRLTDFMAVPPSASTLRPAREVLRVIEALEGAPLVRVEFQPRPCFGHLPRLEQRGALGWVLQHHGELTALHSDLALVPENHGLAGSLEIRPGAPHLLWLTHSTAEPGIVPDLTQWRGRLSETLTFWRDWIGRCTYRGAYAQAVRRSLLALKLLTYAPSGAVVAAATTSLPEALGGARNWDYRFCWLRDSSLTFRVFNDTGFSGEACRYLRWLVLATRLSSPRLQVVYDVYGRTRLTERIVEGFEGWRGNAPVRIGNDAHRQFQLDLYGEAMATVADYVGHGGSLSPQELNLLDGWTATVATDWQRPDRGIWEVRTAPRHFTYSKVMAWVSFDAAARVAATVRLPGWQNKVRHLRATAAAVAEAIETRGIDPVSGGYAATFGGDAVDASLLLLPWFGYTDATAPRMRATLNRVIGELDHHGLVKRYRLGFDGFSSDEGAFAACGFWAADCLARAGDLDEARSRFHRLLTHINDVGLMAEEIDVATGCQLGNFPQAFSHIALINAAMTLEDEERKRRHVMD
jgi:GH15 family glucan-1,4-alpha-glucosidase